MESLGPYLRKLREERGKSLEEVAQETKLQERFVRALEEERLEELPAEVYVKPFLKTYAQFLRIDKKELYSRYEAQKTPAPGKPVPKASVRRTPSPSWAILVAIVVAVVAAVVVLVTSGKKESATPTTAPEEGTRAAPTVPFGEEGEMALPAQEEVSGTRATTARRDSSRLVSRVQRPPSSMQLKIAASDSSWLEVIGDKDTLFYGFIVKGQEVEFQADSGFVLTAGKPEMIRFYLDGKPLLLPFGRSRTIYQLELDRSRASRYLQNQGDTVQGRQ